MCTGQASPGAWFQKLDERQQHWLLRHMNLESIGMLVCLHNIDPVQQMLWTEQWDGCSGGGSHFAVFCEMEGG